jgi:hypothetical protein
MNNIDKKTYIAPDFEYWSAEELDRIEARMSGGGGGSSGSALGSSINPRIVSPGISVNVSSTNYFFKCTVFGAISFNITTSKYCDIDVFVDPTFLTFPDTTLSVSNAKSLSKSREYQLSIFGVPTHTYLIHVKSNESGSNTINCLVTQHVDIDSSNIGHLWAVDDTRAGQTSWVPVVAKMYVNSAQLVTLNHVINEDPFWDAMEASSERGFTVLTTLAGYGITGRVMGAAISLVVGIAGVSLFNSRQQFRTQVNSSIYQNGLCMQVNNIFINGNISNLDVPPYQLFQWTPPSMTGAPGLKGKPWIAYDSMSDAEIVANFLKWRNWG